MKKKVKLGEVNKGFEVPEIVIENNSQKSSQVVPWDNFNDYVFVENDKGKKELHEGHFAEGFVALNKLRYYNGLFYTPMGVKPVEQVSKDIYLSINQMTSKGLANKTKALLECTKQEAYKGELKENERLIPFANGDLDLSKKPWIFHEDDYTEVPYRLATSFIPYDYKLLDTPNFDKWLNDLFEPDDQLTLQEYLGYCLIPTTQGQESLILIGDGGTGKSVIGSILQSILGDSVLTVNDMQDFMDDKFKIPELEYKLVLYDDDLKESALKSTGFFKKLITNTGYITADRKYGQPFKFKPYTRVIACANFMLSSLYDSSDGFFRRLHPILVKPKDPHRRTIKGFDQRVIKEKEGIIQWALIGLERLIENEFVFTTSDRSVEYLNSSKFVANPFPGFIDDCFDFEENLTTTSNELASIYKDWCNANGIDERRIRALQTWLTDNMDKYGIDRSNKIKRGNKTLRGFSGLGIKDEWKKDSFKITLS